MNTPLLADKSGLHTYDEFKILLIHELARSQRYQVPLSLIQLALQTPDQSTEAYKQSELLINDLLIHSLRASDVPAQYGSEFLILLPEADAARGRAVAGRIVRRFQNYQKMSGRKLLPLNLYVGITSCSRGAPILAEQLIGEVNTALEEARNLNSSTYVMYSDISIGGSKPQSV